MQCILLGTGGMMPMPGRPLTSVAVRTGGTVYLFDCGEGTQVPYKSSHVGLRTLNVVAITHLHADHCLGLPGMLMLRSQMEDPDPLTIIGPVGIQKFVRNVIRDLACRITFPIEFIEIEKGSADPRGEPQTVFEDEHVRLKWLPLRHTIFCVGYRLEEHDRPGRFDVEAAKRLGVPPGPLYARLQSGQSVVTPEGTTVTSDQVLGETRRGRHMSFCTDTAPCGGLYRLLDQVDLGFLEGMFLPEHEAEAKAKRHMPVREAARIAHRSGAKQTILVHLSPRYTAADAGRVTKVAREVTPHIRFGRDGERFEVELPE